MIPHDWLLEAQQRIQGHVRRTPLTFDQDNGLYLKWENHQVTGSFKFRGALNKVLSLQPWERERGLVAASAGNHGSGLALAGQMTGTPVMVFVPEDATPLKIERMRSMRAEVILIPGGYGDAEQAGLEYARKNNVTWVSAYNDGQVIAGQGTIGLEVMADLPLGEKYTWVVPCGGGGLISGIGTAIKSLNLEGTSYRLVGVQSEASPYMHALYHLGNQDQVIEKASLADGLAGPVGKNSLTIPITRSTADDIVLVSEDDIIRAVKFAWDQYQEIIEPSASTVLAAILSGRVPDKPAVLIVSGGNIQPQIHQKLIGK
jgi:threonine dehydratase